MGWVVVWSRHDCVRGCVERAGGNRGGSGEVRLTCNGGRLMFELSMSKVSTAS